MKTKILSWRMIGHAALAVAILGTVGTVSHADVFVGADPDGVDENGAPSPGGDGMKWEDPANWMLNTVPGNNGGVLDADGNPVQAVNDDGPVVDADGNPVQQTLTHAWNGQDVVFDTATWDFLAAGEANGIDYLQNETQHRVARFILGEQSGAGATGDLSLTFDFADPAGGVRQVLQTNSRSAVFGSRFGDCVVNMISGEVNTGSRTSFGARAASGTLNITGGTFTVGRSNLQLAVNNDFVDGDGAAEVNISGGSLIVREDIGISGTSSFNVTGSGVTEIQIGANGVNGAWIQNAGGVLSVGLDAGGITPISVNDQPEGDPAVDPQVIGGDVTFAAGAVLNVFDAGGANNALTTVMMWDGTLTGAPTLSQASIDAGWTMEINGNLLQVQNLSLDDPVAGMLGDFDGDGDVDCDDLDGYVGNLGPDGANGAEAIGELAALDFDQDGFLSLADAVSVTEELIVTQPNGVTGTFRGDFNCDGSVSVLGDAFILVGNLNTAVDRYTLGDANFDGTVSVLGDAFVLVGNLNQSNGPQ